MGEEYFLQTPSKQRFYYVLVLLLNILGLVKSTWWDYKPVHKLLDLHGKFVVMMAPVCSFTQIVYLYVNYENLSFEVFGIIIAIYPVSVLVNINIASSKGKVYKSLMKNFMTQIHISNYCTDRNSYIRKKLLMIERFTRYTACYLALVFGLSWIFWITIPLIHNITNREQILNRTLQLQTCVYMWMPFDYGYSFNNWIIIHILNVYIVGNATLIMATFHCLTYMLIYHLIGHIQILKHTLRSSFVAGVSNEETKKRLISIIKHHAFIIRLFKDLESAFGVNVAANYLHNLFSDSFILYQVLNGGDLMSYAIMICAYIGELVLMSFVIEEIRKQRTLSPTFLLSSTIIGNASGTFYIIEVESACSPLYVKWPLSPMDIRNKPTETDSYLSEDLPDVVYAIPWENMTVTNQKIVLLSLSRMQTQMQYKALGGFKAGVQPMISILKTTFSYYVMLETSIESKK